MFVDAVLAIAITLLAIELPRPEKSAPGEPEVPFATFLGEHAGSFFAFVLAFLMLWWIWRTHHGTFDQVKEVSPLVMTLHIPLLLAAVWMPYPTEVFGAGEAGSLATALFAGTEGIMMLSLGLISEVVVRQGLYKEGANVPRLRVETVVNIAIGLYWLATAVLAYNLPDHSDFPVAYLWFGTPLVAYAAARIARRVQKGVTTPADA